MIPFTREERKKEAFRLYEDGRYQESLRLCSELVGQEKDQAVEVLLATNLFATNRLDDAEASFRDLREKMPDSSYVHSYLAKVLEAKGDDGAIAEYARAVHLDPTNQEALRSYAGYLLSHGDCRGALPLLRRLVSLGRKEDDVKTLIRALVSVNEPQEALAAHRNLIGEPGNSHEYLDALLLSADYHSAASAALEAYRRDEDPAFLKKYLSAFSKYDPVASLAAYSDHLLNLADCDILSDYALLLAASGDYRKALETCSLLSGLSQNPAYRHMACNLTAESGDLPAALALFEDLISDELRTKNDLELLERIIGDYRRLLGKTYPPEKALARFLAVVSSDPNVASLLETARFYEEMKSPSEARAWYYRAYRADFLSGGLAYARFLAKTSDLRECEKVMLYVLSNVKRSSDLHRVAAAVVDDTHQMYRMRRLMDHLIRLLDERRMMLNTDGLELLSIALMLSARRALGEADYAECKRLCLRGIDVLPVPARAVRLEDFLALVRECKEHSLADRPVMDQAVMQQKIAEVPIIRQIREELDLDDAEQKVVEFLRSHKRASEIDLRKALGTRRVVGIVNRLIKKAAEKDMTIILKKGVGDDGEVYEYAGN